MSITNKIKKFISSLIHDSIKSAFGLFKVMIPIVIVIKILQDSGLINYVAMPLKPIMGLMGLPAETGLVWAGAIVNNIYTGLIIFVSFGDQISLSQHQATVLGAMMLVAHALPLESAVSKKAGARFLFQALARMAGAITLGIILHMVYSAGDMLTQPATILFPATLQQDTSTMAWVLGQAKNFGGIFVVIMALLTIMRLLTLFGIIELLNKMLRPILKAIGIGAKASAITVIGLTIGLTYGGSLIINEARSGTLEKEDIFYSVTLMGLSHALIEDTFTVTLLGAHFSGILWGRFLFSLVAVAILVRVVRLLPSSFCNRFLWTEPS